MNSVAKVFLSTLIIFRVDFSFHPLLLFQKPCPCQILLKMEFRREKRLICLLLPICVFEKFLRFFSCYSTEKKLNRSFPTLIYLKQLLRNVIVMATSRVGCFHWISGKFTFVLAFFQNREITFRFACLQSSEMVRKKARCGQGGTNF